MTLRPPSLGNERGAALYLVAVLMVVFMSLVGLGVDLGRGYIIRNALGTAVDGAALAAARVLPQGQSVARAAAEKIFAANLPAGFLGISSVAAPTITFTTASDGSSLITVTSSAVMPTTFMRIAGGTFNDLNVLSSGTATRRLVDMSFVIDRSGSLSGVFGAVRTASSTFVGKFDDVYDRISLESFSNNTRVHSAIVQPGRGFAKSTIQSQINNLSSNGGTAMAEGLYQGWNQLRLVPLDNQSSLRVIVLFTDGAPNGFPTTIEASTTGGYGVASSCNGSPNYTKPSGATWLGPRTGTIISSDVSPGNNAEVQGLWDTYNTSYNVFVSPTDISPYQSPNVTNFTTIAPCIPKFPPSSAHTPQQGTASGIPLTFPLYDAGLAAQRGLIGCSGTPTMCPNHVQNANNAARNLVEIIADRIRADDTGMARIHIFTLGLGNNLNVGTGADAEQGSAILRRIANDPSSPQYNAAQPEGAYFFAGSVSELDRAFEAIRDRIVRISQ